MAAVEEVATRRSFGGGGRQGHDPERRTRAGDTFGAAGVVWMSEGEASAAAGKVKVSPPHGCNPRRGAWRKS